MHTHDGEVSQYTRPVYNVIQVGDGEQNADDAIIAEREEAFHGYVGSYRLTTPGASVNDPIEFARRCAVPMGRVITGKMQDLGAIRLGLILNVST